MSKAASFNRLAETELREAVHYYQSEAPGPWVNVFCQPWNPPWRKSWITHWLDRHCVVM